MEFPQDRRVVIGAGVAAAVIAVLGVVFVISSGHKPDDTGAPKAGLVVDVGHDDNKVDATRQLPCYVNGQSVGMATHAKCAERNGLPAGQLDVGIDQSGELAYGSAGALLTPLPPDEAGGDAIGKLAAAASAQPPAPTPPPAPAAQTPAQTARGPVAACWRYVEKDWTRLPDMTLDACAQLLFDGRCEKPGGATYGRWGEQTLRLVPGQIEQSPDNRNFKALVRQGANCSVPAF